MSNRSLFALAVAAVGAFTFSQVAFAGEDAAPAKPVPAEAPKAEAPKAEAPKTDAPKTETKVEAPATKTPAPMWSVMMWIGKQVAPNLECACPATAEGEKAWRTWFSGGKDVALAPLRDQLVADGWTADRFVTFFQDMVKKQGAGKCDCAKGECAKGDCAKGEGCCEGKGERADGKPCCGKCGNKDKEPAKTEPAPAPAAKP